MDLLISSKLENGPCYLCKQRGSMSGFYQKYLRADTEETGDSEDESG